MTCRELVDFLMEYLNGELGEAEHETFDRHLAACPTCVDYLESYKTTVRLGQEVCTSTDEVPSDVPSQLIDAILAARPRS